MSASIGLQAYFNISPKLDAAPELEREIALIAQTTALPSCRRGPGPADGEHFNTDLELQTALDTISDAKGDVEALLSRNQMLEAYVIEVECRARTEVKDSREVVEAWTTRALAAESAVARLERALADSEARATAAEQALQRGRQALILLHNAIATAFGYGSVLRERMQSEDPNVPGLGVVRDKVVQLAMQIEGPEGRSQPRITHRAA